MGRKTRRTIDYTELNALLSKKCVQPFHSSHIYLNVVFRLDRFRQVFKLPDVGARDFDLALQMSKDNYRAGGKTIFDAPSMHQIIKSLAKPYIRNMSDMSFDEKIYAIISKRLLGDDDENKLPHPLGADPKAGNVQTLPNEAMIYLLSRLLDLRMQSDETELVDEWYDPDQLRATIFGTDGLGNEYFYFGDFRIFVKLAEAETYEGTVSEDSLHKYPWAWMYKEFADSTEYKCVADTRESWRSLIGLLSSLGDTEKAIAKGIEAIFEDEQEHYVAELNRRSKVIAEERRLQSINEREAMKLLGVVRTSSRIQAKELERKKIEEEKQKTEKENRKRKMEMIAAGKIQAVPDQEVPKPMSREERFLLREAKRVEQLMVEGRNEGSLEPSEEGTSTRSDSIQPSGSRVSDSEEREISYLNYSLNYDTHSSSTKRARYEDELEKKTLQNGQIQDGSVNNGRINHNQNHLSGGKNEDEANSNDIVDAKSLVGYCVQFPHGSASNGHSVPTLNEFYQYLYAPAWMRTEEAYRNEVMVLERLVKSTLTEYYVEWRQRQNAWSAFEFFLAQLQSPASANSLSRLNVVQLIDWLITQRNPQDSIQKSLLLRSVSFISTAWMLTFQIQSPEDAYAKAILTSMENLLRT
ncbi:hypothetical protein WR25_12600 [Diploscapter pachys]|uniref:Uncharacterized protein n=1 Tax=Diploscapter pachys TaxID=2018661 RepID=A0A2A2KNM6_9BILA|nr:hypothetical protein WR25_12600 [Diploscapter pachys]